MLAQWLHQQLSDAVPGLAWVEVRETHSAGSQFDGKTFRIWKEQRFESAILSTPTAITPATATWCG
ncbi:Uncharacterised protein [Chromobacterium violaceum]|uniref:Uncharacterized protein n=1 Tax=Chromobacterium violaceum TaxID=536 RepID=A0A447TI96_CHRVL|nr:Uncharacterised protein [Chromobacterium violaceum]